MQFALSLIALATAVAATPLLETRDNCTTYTSTAAGTVCYHTPSDCSATYIVPSGGSCTAIGNLFGNFTLSQFFYWNPDVGQTCLGIRAYVPVCINTPWYKFTPPVQSAPGTVVPASKIPVPIMPSITSACTQYEFVGSGSDYRVESIIAKNGISMDQFLSWNTYVDKTYPTVWEGYWVCVSVSVS